MTSSYIFVVSNVYAMSDRIKVSPGKISGETLLITSVRLIKGLPTLSKSVEHFEGFQYFG